MVRCGVKGCRKRVWRGTGATGMWRGEVDTGQVGCDVVELAQVWCHGGVGERDGQVFRQVCR